MISDNEPDIDEVNDSEVRLGLFGLITQLVQDFRPLFDKVLYQLRRDNKLTISGIAVDSKFFLYSSSRNSDSEHNSVSSVTIFANCV